MLELIEEKNKAIASTLITCLDSCTLIFACSYYMYGKPDEEILNKVTFYVGTVASVLYLLIVPESPRWLFNKYGSNSPRGIEVMNYIARFNGSRKRVPSFAVFDAIGQMVEEN